jgi:hypothetical protein
MPLPSAVHRLPQQSAAVLQISFCARQPSRVVPQVPLGSLTPLQHVEPPTV